MASDFLALEQIKAKIKILWEDFLQSHPFDNQFVQPNNSQALISQTSFLLESQLELLSRYYMLLEFWNNKTDLISPAPLNVLINRHFIDCLAVSLLIKNILKPDQALSYLDIGSGAGLPGIVLSIMEPNRKCFLCEPRKKRAAFLEHVVQELGLNQVKILSIRAKHVLPIISSHNVGLTITRAIERKSEQEFFKSSQEVLAPNGFITRMVGPSFDTSLSEVGLHLEQDLFYKLPLDGAARRLIAWKCFT